MCEIGGEWRLYGVGTSRVCNMSAPSVFTRVSSHKNWINEEAGRPVSINSLLRYSHANVF